MTAFPVRRSYLDIQLWLDAGYDGHDIGAFLAAYESMFDNENLAFDLRVPGANAIDGILNTMVVDVLEKSEGVARAMDDAATRTTATFAAFGGAEMLRRELDRSQLSNTPVNTSPPPLAAGVATPPPLPPPPSSGAGGDGGLGTTIVIIISVTVSVAVIVVGFAIAWFARRKGSLRFRRRSGSSRGPLKAPGAGPGTCLLVTDIENSTHLWETLPEKSMDCALRLHSGCLRELMLEHRGYESATEGDSFIVAFVDALSAVRFAVAAQAALLNLSWPTELLAAPFCSEVWAVPASCSPSRPVTGGGGSPSATSHSGAFNAPAWAGGGGPPVQRSGPDTLTPLFSGASYVQPASPGRFPPGGGGSFEQLAEMEEEEQVPEEEEVAATLCGLPLPSCVTVLVRKPSAPVSSAVSAAGGWGPGPGVNGVDSESGADDSVHCVGSGGLNAGGVDPSSRTNSRFRKGIRGASVSGVQSTGPSAAALPLTGMSHRGTLWGLHDAMWQARSQHEPGAVLIARGLRVRVGLHTGVPPEAVSINKASARTTYSGACLGTTKAIADCANGGQVTLSEPARTQLVVCGKAHGATLLHLGTVAEVYPRQLPMGLYLALSNTIGLWKSR
ncbi:hypothetical protein FOA52_010589 [Chlamydomonas sp. UWO 241]|nr:hypothetical protein FOA52_010589 [Chlamydomonas sp. UWO 241]